MDIKLAQERTYVNTYLLTTNYNNYFTSSDLRRDVFAISTIFYVWNMLIHIAARLLHLFAYCTVSLVKQLVHLISAWQRDETLVNHVSTLPGSSSAASPGEAAAAPEAAITNTVSFLRSLPSEVPMWDCQLRAAMLASSPVVWQIRRRPPACTLNISNAWGFDSPRRPLAF